VVMTKAEIEVRLQEYMEALRSMETERWVGQYDENGTAEDPVGGPVIKGRENLTAFFNGVKKNVKLLDLKPELIIIAPPEAAIRWKTRGVMQSGQEAFFNGISLYKFADDGKLLQMRAFWDPREMAQQLKK
jgi:steroid Delta-isomerase